jgi:hypothetical protein
MMPHFVFWRRTGVSERRGIGCRMATVALGGTLVVAASLGMTMQLGTTHVVPSRDSVPDIDRSPGDEMPALSRELLEHQSRRLREAHQKEVFADTARLLQLATELKQEADNGTKPTPGTLKDVDEMAKLAKRVSERIKTQ